MLKRITRKDIIRFTWYYWYQNKKVMPVLLIGMALAAFIDTLFPMVIGNLVSEVEAMDKSAPGLPKGILIAFGLLIALDVCYHSIRNGTHLVFGPHMAMNTLQSILGDSFEKVQRFSADWHTNNFAGATVRRITRGMWAFDTYQDILFLYLYPTAIVLISIIGLMTLHWPIMGLVTAIVVTLYAVVSLWTVLVVNAPRFQAAAAEDTKVGGALADAVTGNPTIKAFGNEDYEDHRFAGVVGSWRTITLRSWQMATWMDLLRRLTSVLMLVGMMGTVLWLMKQGRADTGDVVYVFTTVWIIFAYLRHIGEQIANMQKAISEMEDVVWYWKTDVAVKDKPEAVMFKPADGEIIFDNILFAYGNKEEPIYKDFSIDIASGEKVALVGHSGSGKSTFVKLLQRLYDVQGGEIRIDGQNIADVTQASLRKAIALVPQDPILFHRTLLDNIAYGNDGANKSQIVAAAKQAYAHDFIEGLPQGYETLVGERGIKLSGGERQRVAIARAILSDAPILILDEATSSLDSVSEHYIQMALTELMKGRTTITIAHRLSTIKDVDRILVFDQGRIVEQGTHGELLQNEASHYKKLYDMQVLGLLE